MPNRAYLEDDIIHEIYDGDQDEASMQEIVAQRAPLSGELVRQKKPILLLADATTVHHASLHARQVASKTLLNLPFAKIAIFGANTYMNHIMNLVIVATGRQSKVRLFKTAEEAKAWLQS